VLTPIHAWRHGERMLAAALASAMLGYTTLWISAAVGGAA
jgi:hypothetical protein